MQDRYDRDYVERQVAKSDAQVPWHSGRTLRYVKVAVNSRTRVLDVGCGVAPGPRYLLWHGAMAVGTDVPRRVALARGAAAALALALFGV